MNAGALNIETAPVDSSQIAEIGYDATTPELTGARRLYRRASCGMTC